MCLFSIAHIEIEEPKQEVEIVATCSGFRINCTASGRHIRDIWWLRDNEKVVQDHFEETRATVRGSDYAYGQTQATMSSLTWRNHSATCDLLEKLSGRYSCIVTGRSRSVKTKAESAGIVLDLQCECCHGFLLLLLLLIVEQIAMSYDRVRTSGSVPSKS